MTLSDSTLWQQLLGGEKDPYSHVKEALARQLSADDIDELLALAEGGSEQGSVSITYGTLRNSPPRSTTTPIYLVAVDNRSQFSWAKPLFCWRVRALSSRNVRAPPPGRYW
jgi:hypothetical protein